MSIYCRYLLGHYFKVFGLAIFSFIAILLVSRLQEIAEFATLGTPWRTLIFFTFYQIPYILPIAIPISCLLSSLLLFQRLSQTHELTALRACGFSLSQVLTPLLTAAFFLSLLTFYITSEVATSCHLQTRKMVYDLTSVNPLLLLQNAKVAQLKGAYVQMSPVAQGEEANHLVVALPGKQMTVCMAKEISVREGALKGSQISLISTLASESETFDHLFIENQHYASSPAPELASLMRTRGWKIAHDHLSWRLLKARKQVLRKQEDFKSRRSLIKADVEIVRRLSLTLATFTFTLMGIAFGMEISRNRTKRGVLFVLLLTATALIAFFLGHELDHLFWPALGLFIGPHLIITATSLWTLNRVKRGIE